jgi:hypothetical protein
MPKYQVTFNILVIAKTVRQMMPLCGRRPAPVRALRQSSTLKLCSFAPGYARYNLSVTFRILSCVPLTLILTPKR